MRRVNSQDARDGLGRECKGTGVGRNGEYASLRAIFQRLRDRLRQQKKPFWLRSLISNVMRASVNASSNEFYGRCRAADDRTGRMIVKAKTSRALACSLILLVSFPIAATHAEPSVEHCRSYAEDYASGKSRGQVALGALVGSSAGTGIGMIFHAPGAGAVIGTGLGVIAGGNRRSQVYKKVFEDAFIDCMAGRAPAAQ